MRLLFNALLVVCLITPAFAQPPETSLRPVMRVASEAKEPSVPKPVRSAAGIRPEVRPDPVTLVLLEELAKEIASQTQTDLSQPVEITEPVLAFATATPQAVARALRPAARSDAVVQRAMAKRQKKRRGSVCGDPELQGEVVGFVPGRIPGCGIDEAIRLHSVEGIPLSQRAMIDCRTAKALKTWVNKGLKPAVGSKGGGVARINVAAHYVCRTRNHQPGAKISEHGRGRAIDISSITLRDNSEISVLDHWGKGRLGRALRRMHASACGIFGTVLGPESDRFHQDHFHFDTARHRGGSYCR